MKVLNKKIAHKARDEVPVEVWSILVVGLEVCKLLMFVDKLPQWFWDLSPLPTLIVDLSFWQTDYVIVLEFMLLKYF